MGGVTKAARAAKSVAVTARGTGRAAMEVGSAFRSAVRSGEKVSLRKLNGGGYSLQAGRKARVEWHAVAKVVKKPGGGMKRGVLHYHAGTSRHKFFTPQWVKKGTASRPYYSREWGCN